jgi:preprotein translocase subunit Sec63
MRSADDIDPYAVLGVPRTATEEEIRAAYRELVARYHPDRHQGNPLEELAAAKLAEINRAYEILSDPERRADYDSGRPPWPRPVDSPFARGAARVRRRNRWLLVIGILLLLPLLVRFGVFLVRLLFRIFRVGGEGLAVLRGTPAGGVAVLLGVIVFVLLLLRRHRRKNR